MKVNGNQVTIKYILIFSLLFFISTLSVIVIINSPQITKSVPTVNIIWSTAGLISTLLYCIMIFRLFKKIKFQHSHS